MIDYTFRYAPSQDDKSPQPRTSQEAREALVEGNRTFARWVQSCREAGPDAHEQFVVPSRGLETVVGLDRMGVPTQKPFAVVLGCSDARVPAEMLFGQGFNDLFVIRNAGNVLSDVSLGSIDFTLAALKDSVRVIVVLGHTHCGAVKGAVAAYLDTEQFWSEDFSPNLRTIFQRIFVAVRETDNMLHQVWGPDAASMPGYRDVLTDAAVCLNAAHSAYAIRQEVEEAGHKDIEVLFGAYDVRNQHVCMPILPHRSGNAAESVNLASAPRHPSELAALAREIVEAFRPAETSAG